ncbi:MAG: hypothetical protein NUW37_18920 [Planctomycetes bacterium]|nr:hypothetical protein [Planctomycetota bacterium]
MNVLIQEPAGGIELDVETLKLILFTILVVGVALLIISYRKRRNRGGGNF